MDASVVDRIAQSELLHRRVRAFATHAVTGVVDTEALQASASMRQSFVSLACDIAAFQTGREFDSWAQVVSTAVPADCFKFGPVFRFPSSLATTSFRTSGTTASNTGTHLIRDAQTYEELSLLWGNVALGLKQTPNPIIVALAPWTGKHTPSSLGYMMQRMMERFDGRSLSEERLEAGFSLADPLRWLVSERGVDVDGLRRVAEVAAGANARVVLLATSFALVELLDALESTSLPLPVGSLVMPTGGFKGRTRTIVPEVMAHELRRIFGDVDLVGEYGMTELASQLYEGTRRGGVFRGEPGVYVEPPWLQVVPCCPQTLEPVADGEPGLACFVDLGNVDSAVALLTQDLVQREAHGIRLLGRQPTAPVRGCSLAIEALLRPSSVRPGVTAGASVGLASQTDKLESPVGESFSSRQARVLQLIAGAEQCKQHLLQDERQLQHLADAGFMSVAGVKLALELALETSPSTEEVAVLVARAAQTTVGEGACVWVVLSSTVFTAAHRAAALALSISPRVKLKPSRRQPHFAAALAQACDNLFEVVQEIVPLPGDVVLAFGSNETLEAVRTALPRGVTFEGYGHGMGLAMVGPGADMQACAKALAIDMVLFEQQGCLSPRLLMIDEACDAGAFIFELRLALNRLGALVPVAISTPEHLAQAVWERRVAQRFASVTSHDAGWLAVYSEDWCQEHRLPLFGTPRTIGVVQTAKPLQLLGPIAPLVTCVGYAGVGLESDIAQHLPGARCVPLGMMQRPRFDGPVDLRSRT